MQGLLAYVYDNVVTGTWMELNQCRFNHLGAPILAPRIPFTSSSKCISDSSACEDCTQTDFSNIYNMHFAACKKPWTCVDIKYFWSMDSLSPVSLDVDHCYAMHAKWHAVRTDLETYLIALTDDEEVQNGQVGSYKRDIFQGHCTGPGIQNYIGISGTPEARQQLDSLYSRSIMDQN
jgi:hypothetical protein